jgi:2-succinyl-6-hydroxy-2,4-cyclohexadiene-1-carboxylate synthase
MTVVVLLHGFTGSPGSFREVANDLAARGARVETPVLLGHGARDDAGVVGFEAEVDRLAGHVRALGVAAHLVGYSLGGRMAIGLLVRHPDLFTGATLVSAQPGLTTGRERIEREAADERWCELLEREGTEAFVDAWEKLPLFATQAGLPRDVLENQRRERLSHDAAGLARSLRVCGLGKMPPYWTALRGVAVPTTLMVGENDPKFAAINFRMQELLPRAAVSRVAGAGHNVLLEHPRAITDAVLQAFTEGA